MPVGKLPRPGLQRPKGAMGKRFPRKLRAMRPAVRGTFVDVVVVADVAEKPAGAARVRNVARFQASFVTRDVPKYETPKYETPRYEMMSAVTALLNHAVK